MTLVNTCPCSSKLNYLDCCGKYIESQGTAFAQLPETAEILMRSRFSAYIVKNAAYLIKTHHPSTQYIDDPDIFEHYVMQSQFTHLKILHVNLPNIVTFCAYFIDPYSQTQGKMIEQSIFIQENNQWFYLHGTHPTQKQACICGRAKKFKHCCGRDL